MFYWKTLTLIVPDLAGCTAGFVLKVLKTKIKTKDTAKNTRIEYTIVLRLLLIPVIAAASFAVRETPNPVLKASPKHEFFPLIRKLSG